MKTKGQKHYLHASCLFGSSLKFLFGAQQNYNFWATQTSQDSTQTRDFWRQRTSFNEVVSQSKLDN